MAARHAVIAVSNLLRLLNKGTKDDLFQFPGFGNKTVHNLLSIRQEHGEIRLRDMMVIKGVGVGSLQKLTQNEDVAIIVKICQYVQEGFQDMLKEVHSDHHHCIALDVGLSSVAMVNITSSLKVLDWCNIQYKPPRPYSPGSLYKEVSLLIDTLPLTSNSVLVIEGQSHRPMGHPSKGFMDISLRLRLIEGMLYGVARERGISVYSISPKMVARYFETNRNGQYYKKKQATTLAVSHLVGAGGLQVTSTPLGNCIDISDHLVEHYWEHKKLDDLSDCLLQALSFHEWMEIYKVW